MATQIQPETTVIQAALFEPLQARGGRTELQQRQKQSSRQKLLAAAQTAFADSSYAGTAVDDIVKLAGVNRSTFYRHFDGKFALAKALFSQFWPPLFAVYDNWAPSDPPTDDEIGQWVDRLIAFYRQNRPMFITIGQIESLEPEGMRWGETIRLEVIRLLGERLPAFKAASAEDAAADARVRVWLLMIEIEMCVFDLAFNDEANRGATVQVLGEEFRRFIDRGRRSATY